MRNVVIAVQVQNKYTNISKKSMAAIESVYYIIYIKINQFFNLYVSVSSVCGSYSLDLENITSINTDILSKIIHTNITFLDFIGSTIFSQMLPCTNCDASLCMQTDSMNNKL